MEEGGGVLQIILEEMVYMEEGVGDAVHQILQSIQEERVFMVARVVQGGHSQLVFRQRAEVHMEEEEEEQEYFKTERRAETEPFV